MASEGETGAKGKKRTIGLADVPASGATGDMGLGLESAADALAEFMSSCATPLTIGLQGDWGSGKTSLMNFVDERMDAAMARAFTAKRVRRGKQQSIWFNTWTYSQFNREDQLSISLMTNLPRELQLKIAATERRRSETFQRCLRVFGKSIRAAMNVATAVASGGAIKAQDVASLFAEEEEPDHARLLGALRDSFADLVTAFLDATESDRLIVYVDDLDRLKPSRAVEVLEVIKNFLDVPHCVFVLAIDYDVVVAGLRERKGQEPTHTDGKSFFDKIIQVPFRMPVTLYDTSAFVRTQLAEHTFGLGGGEMAFWLSEQDNSRRLERLIRHSVGANPRSIKRLLNLFTLQTILTKQMEGGKGMGKAQARRMLLPITCLQMTNHMAYQFLIDAGQEVDAALIALSAIGRLADRHDANEDWDSALDELRERWPHLPEARWSAVGEWIERAHVLSQRMRQKQQLGPKQFRDIEEVAKLTFDAIDLNGDGQLDRSELAYLEQLFRVADMVSDQSEASEQPSTRSYATLDELRQRAAEDGVGHLYEVLMHGLRSCFDARSTTKTAVRWQGAVDGRRRKLALMTSNAQARSVDLTLSLPVLAEYFGIFSGELTENLRRSCNCVESGETTLRVRVSTPDDAERLIEVLAALRSRASAPIPTATQPPPRPTAHPTVAPNNVWVSGSVELGAETSPTLDE